MEITRDKLISMGVDPNTEYENQINLDLNQLSTYLTTEFQREKIISKSQVTMLLANMLAISNNFQLKEETWNVKSDPNTVQKSYYKKPTNDYGNTPGEVDEAYMYRGRGFIPIIGKRQYSIANDILPIDILSDPDNVTWNLELLIKVSIIKWKYIGLPISESNSTDTAYKLSNGGSSNNFSLIVNLLNNSSSEKMKLSFDAFYRVLNTYDLLGINVEGTIPGDNDPFAKQLNF